MKAKPQAKPRKLLPPDVPEALVSASELDAEMCERLRDDEDLEGIRFEGVTFEALPAKRASFRGCVFERCTFAPADVTLDFMDCVFAGCDFAGAQMPKVLLRRVRVERCRGVGMYLTDGRLQSVAFAECQLAYANFGLAKLEVVSFAGCDLSQSAFVDAVFTQVTLEDCKLRAAEWIGVSLDGVDLRTDDIEGIVVGGSRELTGAIVTPLQAVGLARLLGVRVEA